MLIELGADGMSYQRLADTSDDFHTHWDTLALVLAASALPLTRQQIRAAWPADLRKPHEASVWRWLDRAVDLGLACRFGEGTKTNPYRFGLVKESSTPSAK